MDEKDKPGLGGEINGHESLLRSVEKTWGRVPRTPKDFEELRESVSRVAGTLLSATTLKRMWGYLDEPQVHRRSTLDVLARYCGWRDYGAFGGGVEPEAESGPVGGKVLTADKDIRRGDRLRLHWAPGRVCDIAYQGGGMWRVTAAEGTKLRVGDMFCCRVIADGEPLYLTDLRPGAGRPGGVYVCGRRSGVRVSPPEAGMESGE